MNAPIALSSSSLRRLLAGVALVAGFAAVSTPARADDTVTIGGYTVNTTPAPPPSDGSTGSYGTGSYGTGSDGT